MSTRRTPGIDQATAWLVAVPKRQEFTKPAFHFGERVKWRGYQQAPLPYRTGRIIGMRFVVDVGWHYTLEIDDDRAQTVVDQIEPALTLVQDDASVRPQLESQSVWLMTADAAAELGISAEQLRKLRRRGLFKVGYHYRDTSVPGSGLPRWQWHRDRCAKALAVPPEQR